MYLCLNGSLLQAPPVVDAKPVLTRDVKNCRGVSLRREERERGGRGAGRVWPELVWLTG